MKKLESGRSMVEMLGVLAVVGVLSAGGILGFSVSMTRYRANALLDKATKYASLAYSTSLSAKAMKKPFNPANFKYENQRIGELQEGEELSLGEGAIATNGVVTVIVTFSSQEICRVAKNMIGELDDCSTGGVTTIKFKQN